MYRRRPGPVRAAVAVTVVVAALSACSVGVVARSSGSSSTSGPAPAGTTPAVGASTSAPNTTSSPPPPTTVPTVPPLAASDSSGPLSVSYRTVAPFGPPTGRYPTVATEAVDGAIFFDAPDASTVWVVDGDTPPALSETMSAPILSLAADADNLYVATTAGVFSFRRTGGDQLQRWAVPVSGAGGGIQNSPVELTAADGVLWVSVEETGSGVGVYRIDPASPAGPQLVVDSRGDVVTPDGTLFYERSDSHLVRVDPDGAVTVGPALPDQATPEGGGVARIVSVGGSQVWVETPAGQGLDAAYSGYSVTTLAPVGGFAGSVGTAVIDSGIGPLTVATFPSPLCPSATSTCVLRSTPNGGTNPLAVSPGTLLVGPFPAVIGANTAGAMEVDRLA